MGLREGVDRVGKSKIDSRVMEECFEDCRGCKRFPIEMLCEIDILIPSSKSQDSLFIGPCVNISNQSTA